MRGGGAILGGSVNGAGLHFSFGRFNKRHNHHRHRILLKCFGTSKDANKRRHHHRHRILPRDQVHLVDWLKMMVGIRRSEEVVDWSEVTALEMKKLVEESGDSSNAITEEEVCIMVLGTSKSSYALEAKVKDQEEKTKAYDDKMAKLFQMVEVLQRDRGLNSPGVGNSLHESHSPIQENEPEF